MSVPKPCRVLVIDDHRDTAESLAHLVNALGHEARFLVDPTKTEALVDEFNPHVLFLDIGMPVIDGWTLARKIRDRPTSNELKIVAITAYAEPEDRAKSRRAGFDAHIQKPIDPRLIDEILEQCFMTPIRPPR